MFYVLSRFGAWLASPMLYVSLLFFIALFAKSRLRKVLFAGLAVLLLLLLSMQPVYRKAMEAWVPEETFSVDSTQHYVYCVLPGGFTGFDAISGRVEYGDAGDRLIDAVGLLKAGIVDTLVITGDGAANMCLECFERHLSTVYGVEPSRLLVEHAAKNTYQNFEFTVGMIGLDRLSGHTLVVNSAMYMRRTILCASLVGLDADFYSIDYSRTPCQGWEIYVPQPTVYDDWLSLNHEFIGYISYLLAYGL